MFHIYWLMFHIYSLMSLFSSYFAILECNLNQSAPFSQLFLYLSPNLKRSLAIVK
jgi:hypothetical protein